FGSTADRMAMVDRRRGGNRIDSAAVDSRQPVAQYRHADSAHRRHQRLASRAVTVRTPVVRSLCDRTGCGVADRFNAQSAWGLPPLLLGQGQPRPGSLPESSLPGSPKRSGQRWTVWASWAQCSVCRGMSILVNEERPLAGMDSGDEEPIRNMLHPAWGWS